MPTSTCWKAKTFCPATRRGVQLLKQDESRHIAYGIYLISRLIAEDASLWDVAEAQMN
jgi:ribonucleoside-diphosphate reductase beta chain